MPEPGQSQVGGQLPAAEPHRRAYAGGVAGEGDGVRGDLAGTARAEPLADQHARVRETDEELLLARCASSGGADRRLSVIRGDSFRRWR